MSTEELLERVVRSTVLYEAAMVENLSRVHDNETGALDGPRATGTVAGGLRLGHTRLQRRPR